MDEGDKSVLKRNLVRIVESLKMTAALKAQLYACNVIREEVLDVVMEEQLEEDQPLNLARRLMKDGDDRTMRRFLRALKLAKQEELADFLEARRKPPPVTPSGSRTKERASQQQLETATAGECHKPSDTSQDFSRKLSLPNSEQTDKTWLASGQRSQPKKNGTQALRENSEGHTTEVQPYVKEKGRANATGNHSNYSTKPNETATAETGTDLEQLRDQVRESMRDFEDVKPQQGDVILVDSYKLKILHFAKGERKKHPGPFQSLDFSKRAYHNLAIKTFPPSVVAKLCHLLGGHASSVLRLDSQSGTNVFVSHDTRVRYVVVFFRLQPAAVTLGDWWLAADAPIVEAAASALGWYPTRMRNCADVPKDLTPANKVMDWFKMPRNQNTIDVWQE